MIAAHPSASRRALSRQLCEAWDWKQPNGELKDLVCRGLMLALHRDVGSSVATLGEAAVFTIFLGDNVYWDGLPVEGGRGRRAGERKLEAQINLVLQCGTILSASKRF